MRYTDEAIRAAVELSANYINDRKLPDKAIDVIDEVGASQMLLPEHKRRKTVTLRDVEEIVAKIARIPPKIVSADDKETLRNLERDLKTMVFGQDKAIEALSAAIKLARAGLREPEKPIGYYLFSGPTGVGKTEVARQLAATMGIELIRFDMSEYMERHTRLAADRRAAGLCRLRPGRPADRRDRPASACGAAARRDREGASGPVQHPAAGDGPRQADRPQRQDGRFPQRHPDHDDQCRRLRHGEGGDRLRPRGPRGRGRGRDQAAVHAGVPQPARCDHRLRRPDAGDRRAGWSTSSSCSSRRSSPTATSRSSSREPPDWLAENGYDRLYGARPLARVIQEHIKKPLAEELLFGKLVKGGAVKVTLKDGKLDFEIIEAAPPGAAEAR